MVWPLSAVSTLAPDLKPAGTVLMPGRVWYWKRDTSVSGLADATSLPAGPHALLVGNRKVWGPDSSAALSAAALEDECVAMLLSS